MQYGVCVQNECLHGLPDIPHKLLVLQLSNNNTRDGYLKLPPS